MMVVPDRKEGEAMALTTNAPDGGAGKDGEWRKSSHKEK